MCKERAGQAAALALAISALFSVCTIRAVDAADRDAEVPARVAAVHPPRAFRGEEITLKAARFRGVTETCKSTEPEHPEPHDHECLVSGIRITYLGQRQIYGYDLCAACCGSTTGLTASGTAAEVGRTVACNDLPFGTVLWIDGIGERVVEDRGGMANGALDVLCNSHPECYSITGPRDVYIVERFG